MQVCRCIGLGGTTAGSQGRKPLGNLLRLRVLCRPSGARLLGRWRSRGLRPWLSTLAPPEPEHATPRTNATPVAPATPADSSCVGQECIGRSPCSAGGGSCQPRSPAGRGADRYKAIPQIQEYRFSPGGTRVGSQGRKPLDDDILEQQSPGGGTDCGKHRMGAADPYTRPRRQCRASLARCHTNPGTDRLVVG